MNKYLITLERIDIYYASGFLGIGSYMESHPVRQSKIIAAENEASAVEKALLGEMETSVIDIKLLN